MLGANEKPENAKRASRPSFKNRPKCCLCASDASNTCWSAAHGQRTWSVRVFGSRRYPRLIPSRAMPETMYHKTPAGQKSVRTRFPHHMGNRWGSAKGMWCWRVARTTISIHVFSVAAAILSEPLSVWETLYRAQIHVLRRERPYRLDLVCCAELTHRHQTGRWLPVLRRHRTARFIPFASCLLFKGRPATNTAAPAPPGTES